MNIDRQITTNKILKYVDLFLCGANGYFGILAFTRNDWLWTAIGLGLSFLMLHGYNRRKQIIEILEAQKRGDRDRIIS